MRFLPSAGGHPSEAQQRPKAGAGTSPLVVVGVSNGGCSDAVEWAVAEASSRHGSLRIVHAFAWPLAVDPCGAVAVASSETGAQAAADLIVQEAASRARSVAPDVDITTRTVVGAPVPVMRRQAELADLVVLGGRGSGHRFASRDGGVAAALVARADCPVAVIRPFHGVTPGPSAARVVVGVDGSRLSMPAVGLAFQAASRRGVGLTAVHSCVPRSSDDCSQSFEQSSSLRSAWQTLDRSLAPWRVMFPAVDVRPKLVAVHPSIAIVAESSGAALVVVGCRGRGRFRRRLFGSVSQTVLVRAHSPITVVRTDHDATRSR